MSRLSRKSGPRDAGRPDLVFAWVLAFVAAFAWMGCAHPPSRAVVSGARSFQLHSEEIGQTFQIDLWGPIPELPIPDGPIPVVYVLDGNSQFAMVTQIVGPMMFAGQLPPMVLVGVGYVVDSPFEVVALRTRDFLPSEEEGYAERMASQGMPLPDGVRPGGADAFLRFLEEKVKPFVRRTTASRWAIDENDETLVGLSYGGTFASHVLFESPASFERYVIGSPVLDWDESTLFLAEAAYAARSQLLPAKVFFSAGALETRNGIRAGTERMIETLLSRGYEGLDLHSHVFAEETHQSVIAPTMSRGLRAVFGAWP